MDKKLSTIIEGVVLVVLGILVAIFGATTVLDIYFGILFLVFGVALTVLAIVKLAKTKELEFSTTFLASALLVIGSSLLAGFLTFGVLINVIVLLLIALGAGLVFYGVFTLVKKETFAGIFQIVIGVVLVVLASLYLAIPEFRTAFWIIVGIVMALYGVLTIVSAFLTKKEK